MSLENTRSAFETLRGLKLKYLRTWEPTSDSISLANMTSIPEMAKTLNIEMSACMDVKEIHKAAYDLSKSVATLNFEEFTTWNRGELERAQETGQFMSEISSQKLLALLGFNS